MGRLYIALPQNETNFYFNRLNLDPHGKDFHSEYWGGQHISFWYAFGLICLALFLTIVILLCAVTTLYFWHLNNQKYDPTQQYVDGKETDDPEFDTVNETSHDSKFSHSKSDGLRPVLVGNSNRLAMHERAKARNKSSQSILNSPNSARIGSPYFTRRTPSRSPRNTRSPNNGVRGRMYHSTPRNSKSILVKSQVT